MSERCLRLKQRLAAGGTVFGAWLNVAEASVAEIVADAGFDYVLIDGEHAPWTPIALANALLAFRGVETVPMVRVAWNDAVMIKHALDLGAEGIMAPMVRTAQEARQLVSACKYPPKGTRGFGPRRASGYYKHTDAYLAAANAGTFVMPQIEHIDSVPLIDEILSVEGVDAICLGPADISGSAGLFMQLDHPTVEGALDTILAAARARNIACCSGVPLAAHAQLDWIEKGARMALLTSDTAVLVKGFAATLEAMRTALSDAEAGKPRPPGGSGWRVG
jgi:2-keto-3-deoxy-L-rhamnonate aldolase RhmA